MERRTSSGSVTIATISPLLNLVDPPCEAINKDDLTMEKDTDEDDYKSRRYPFANVLRMRVLQVVCGISSMIMGTVGLIEEKGYFNLGFGIPAGVVTVIAAGTSIHSSRGFSGYKPSTCIPGTWLSHLKFLGPSIPVATTLTLTWTLALVLHLILCVLACHVILHWHWVTVVDNPFGEVQELEDDHQKDWNYRMQAGILLFLSVCTLVTAIILLRVDCLYDPD